MYSVPGIFCQDCTYTKIAIFSLFQGWEMPYAGQNFDSFKKSSIPDPADIGEKKACGFRENFFPSCNVSAKYSQYRKAGTFWI